MAASPSVSNDPLMTPPLLSVPGSDRDLHLPQSLAFDHSTSSWF